jgi:hypothetical protein
MLSATSRTVFSCLRPLNKRRPELDPLEVRTVGTWGGSGLISFEPKRFAILVGRLLLAALSVDSGVIPNGAFRSREAKW